MQHFDILNISSKWTIQIPFMDGESVINPVHRRVAAK